MKQLLVSVTVVVLAVLLSGVSLAQTNPFIGTWKLNIAKSQFGLGDHKV